jgi:D-amino-acid dehydrogenase
VSVIVVGGGAVGLCIAEALSSRGAEVVVLEADRCGTGASAGNAGWITSSVATPIPGPGVIGQSLRWLIDPSGPLWIRPTLEPALLGWVAGFVVHCSRRAYRDALAVLQAAAKQAGAAFDQLWERGIEFELHRDSLLYPAFERAELDHLVLTAAQLRQAGLETPLEQLGPSDLLALEPALAGRVLGGLVAHDARRIRPELFVAATQRALAARGVQIHELARVTSLSRDPGGWLAHTADGAHRGETIVLATGVPTMQLLAPLGARLPVATAKGYSRTYARDPSGPRRPVYLEKPKVAISVFDAGVRVSGTLELGATDLSLSRTRLTAITRAAQQAMPGWRMPADPSDWAGMRSMSPDGLPYIGAVAGLDGIYVGTAHATLGITLAPLTGRLLAELMLERTRSPLLSAFDPARAASLSSPLSLIQKELR